ncbi:hypothetical protein CHS0354_026771 [Potamilus streckersoni]|uniref:Bacterial sugar transferase domain-containing protein n=1 Tax=Potamilus streckersoni TaxID=2493646 RepID=A0AAE0W856_9BIVA|nr:hypothetical protein CHS0354_026771 [Potamilus streckersoni]
MFADALAVTCGWVFAYWLRFNLGLPYPVEDNPFFLYMTVAGIIPLPAVLCFMQAGFYHSRRMDKFHVGYITLIKGILYLMIVILAVLFFFRTVSFSRIFALYFMTGTFIFISLFRYGVRQINRYALMRSPRRRRILIVGNGRTAKNLIEKIRANRIFGVDEVFIALDIEDAGLQREINRVLSDVHVDINFVPDIYHSINLNPAIIDFSGIPVMVLRQSPLYGWNRLVKRLFDITGALTGILIFSIPMLITAVLIRLHSKGSVIYKQRRTGLDGVDFHIYKFRSMRTDAEIQSGAVWAVKMTTARLLSEKLSAGPVLMSCLSF